MIYRTRKVTKGKNMRTINICLKYSCIVNLQELVMNYEFLHSVKNLIFYPKIKHSTISEDYF